MIDEITRKIYEEDQRQRELERDKKGETQRFIEDFRQARELWKIGEREKLEAENRKILEYAQEQQKREGDYQTKKQEREDAKAQVCGLFFIHFSCFF
jgi:hypothetical protein